MDGKLGAAPLAQARAGGSGETGRRVTLGSGDGRGMRWTAGHWTVLLRAGEGW